MPRFTLAPGGPRDATQEFDLCARCAGESSVLEAVLAKKAGVDLEHALATPHTTVTHPSYDFSPRPVPCLSCARILSAEDD
ncbi:MAG: hypothetical protein ACREDK_01810 [Thermoplasmata archaeon]